MKRFIQGEHRGQETFLPASLDDYVTDANPVRVVDIFVDELDLVKLGFEGALPADTGRPAYHPSVLLKIYIYGYLNRIPSSRRLEREAQRNVELMWLTGRLMPDFKTIANFRKDNSKATETALARVIAVFGAAKPHCAYIFANRRANRMKVLVHDGIGVWLAARRLNQGKFHWPGIRQGSELELDTEQLRALVLGLPWQRVGAGGAITLL